MKQLSNTVKKYKDTVLNDILEVRFVERTRSQEGGGGVKPLKNHSLHFLGRKSWYVKSSHLKN